MSYPDGFSDSVSKYFALTWGKVIQNNDPEKRCRVRATVPGYWDNSPWIVPLGMPGAGGPPGRGYIPPAVGAQIAVGFIQGDPAAPFYLCGPPALNEAPRAILEQSPDDSPKLQVFETDTFEIIIIEKPDEKKLILRSKDLAQSIEIDAIDRSVEVKAGNSLILDGAMVSISGVKIQIGGRVVLPVGPPI
jgi:hypothetical protein